MLFKGFFLADPRVFPGRPARQGWSIFPRFTIFLVSPSSLGPEGPRLSSVFPLLSAHEAFISPAPALAILLVEHALWRSGWVPSPPSRGFGGRDMVLRLFLVLTAEVYGTFQLLG